MVIYDLKNPRFSLNSSNCNYIPLLTLLYWSYLSFWLILFKLFKNQHSDNLFIQRKSRKDYIQMNINSCHVHWDALKALDVFWNVTYFVVTKIHFSQWLLILGTGFVHFYNTFAPSYGHFRICFIGSNLFKAIQWFLYLVNLNFY